ncbi:4Fe-4S binding protein [Candidatus Woesearchaeota archaeon]|jgi:ferredoxin|nr:4Fe-4S binding protein [Candidatus Woesearchaeota archaeon]
MVKRKIVLINESKCTGCGVCVPNCQEGALQIIDNKARLISDLFCDGLGACIGHCPEDAITIEEREAEPYDEVKVLELLIPQGANVVKAHVNHLKEHGATEFFNTALDYLKLNQPEIFDELTTLSQQDQTSDSANDSCSNSEPGEPDLPCGCPGSQLRKLAPRKQDSNSANLNLSDLSKSSLSQSILQNDVSCLTQWPVQLKLLPPHAPFFNNSDLLICADCVPFAFPSIHQELIKGRSVAIGCPKLDNILEYQEKFVEIFKQNNIKSITVAVMEVPCCQGLYSSVVSAIELSGKDIPLVKKVISVSGELI